MAKLKVFVVNYDGFRNRMVATTSQKDAAERMKVPLSRLRDFGYITNKAEEIALATEHPGMVMERSTRKHDSPWRPAGGY